MKVWGRGIINRLNFHTSLYLLIGLAAMIMTVAQGSIFYTLLIFISLTVAWHIEKKGWGPFIEEWVASYFTLMAFIVAGVEHFVFTHNFIISMSHFLIYVSIIKVFQKKRQRDYGLLLLISLINVIVAAILTVEMYYLPFLFLYAFLAAYTLILFQDKREREDYLEEIERKGAGEKAIYKKSPLRGLSGSLATIFSFGLPAVFLVFIFFPRFSAAIWWSKSAGGTVPVVLVTGFSEEVELSDIGKILEKFDPVMAVTLYKDNEPYTPKGPLYWRGLSFQYYDGLAWQEFHTDKGRSCHYDRCKVPLSLIRRLPNCPVEDITQEIILQPLDSKILFSLYPPLQLESVGLNAVQHSKRSEVLATLDRRWAPLKYKVTSRIPRPSEEGLRAAPAHYPTHIILPYLQLPSEISPRVHALARKIAPNNKHPTPYDKARAIETFLTTNYNYTLEISHTPGTEPLGDFLFNLKEGHCEYFASAMVVLLRSLGIPSRLVNGFKSGQWNRFGHWYLIRQRDAHSWVEVYFPGIGWITFDPSPIAAPQGPPGPIFPWLSNVRQLFDLLEIRWYSYIIGYEEYQDLVYKAVQRVTSTLNRRIFGGRLRLGRFLIGRSGLAPRGASLKETLRTAAGLLVLTALGLFVFFFRWAIIKPFIATVHFFKSFTPTRRAYPPVKFYHQLLLLLARKGFEKEPTLTPMEFAREVISQAGEPFRLVGEITETFYRVRFGGERLKVKEMSRIKGLLRDLAHLKTPFF